MPLRFIKSRYLRRFAFVLSLSALGCGDDAAPDPSAPDSGPDIASALAAETPEPEAVAEPEPEPEPFVPQIEDGMSVIPAGVLIAGSLPGSIGRVPRSEADAVRIALPAFRIDVDLFGGESPQLNVTRGEAAALCADAGKRLCSELEWERACEGPASDTFAGGETFDAAASSAFGVRGLGAYGEWTSSPPAREVAPSAEEGAVFRGAGGEQEPVLRRCNARRGTEATTQSRHLGFRCCQGEASEEAYPSERGRSRFRALDMDREAIRDVLRRVPELSEHAANFEPSNGDRTRERLGEEGLAALHGWELAPAALSWAPSPGDEVWVFHGHVLGRPLLAAIYPLPEDQLVHATTMILEEGAGGFIVAFTGPERQTLRWSTSLGTSAESGVLALGEDSRLHFEIR